MTNYDKIDRLLKQLPHRLQVSFAVYCANDVVKYLAKDNTVSLKAIQLTEMWLADSSSVTNKELRDAFSSSAAATATAYASYASANAAASAASAAVAPTYASYASANAANAAANAAASATSAAASYAATKEETYGRYLSHLKEMIKNISKLEKEVYNLNKIS